MRWSFWGVLFWAVVPGDGTAGLPPLPEDKPRPEVVQLHRAQSLSFPVLVLGPNPSENAHWLEVVEKAHQELEKVLGQTLPAAARFEYIWLPRRASREEEACPDQFPRQLRTAEGRMTWVVEARGELPRDREALWRTSFICQLQALVLAGGKTGRFSGELADPPFWLVEGLAQRMTPTRWADWAKIVDRYSRTNKRPSLRAVQEWQELGDDKLERIYRSVFCHRLLLEATDQEVDRKALVSWLRSLPLDRPDQAPFFYWAGNSSQESWWKEQTVHPLKQAIPLYSWDESATRLRELIHFNVRIKGETAPRLATLTDMPDSPKDLQDLQSVQDALNGLLNLEAQAHPIWRPIVIQYRQGLSFWLVGKTSDYIAVITEASRMQLQAGKFMEDVGDYLDWVTVNFPMGQPDGSYATYAELVRQLENSKVPQIPSPRKPVPAP